MSNVINIEDIKKDKINNANNDNTPSSRQEHIDKIKLVLNTYLKENETYLLSSKNNTEPTDTKIVSKHAFGILMSGLALNDMMAKPIVKFTSNIDKLILDTGKESLIFPIRYADNDKLFLGLVYSLESDNGDTVMLKLTFHIDSLVKE